MSNNTSENKSPEATSELIESLAQKLARPNDLFRPVDILWIKIDEIEDAPRRIRKALMGAVRGNLVETGRVAK